MTGDCHVPFCGGLGVRFPGATRLFNLIDDETINLNSKYHLVMANRINKESITKKNMLLYAVEDRTPRVHPWMNELYLVSASAEVRSAPQEP